MLSSYMAPETSEKPTVVDAQTRRTSQFFRFAGAALLSTAIISMSAGTYLGYSALANSDARTNVATIPLNQLSAFNARLDPWSSGFEVITVTPEQSRTRAGVQMVFLPGNRMPANYEGNLEVAQVFAGEAVSSAIFSYPDNSVRPGETAGRADGENDWGSGDQARYTAVYLGETLEAIMPDESGSKHLIVMAESMGAQVLLEALQDPGFQAQLQASKTRLTVVLSSPLTDFNATFNASAANAITHLFGRAGALVYQAIQGHSLFDISTTSSAAALNSTSAALGAGNLKTYIIACSGDPTNPEASTRGFAKNLISESVLYVLAYKDSHVCTDPSAYPAIGYTVTTTADQPISALPSGVLISFGELVRMIVNN